MSRLPAWLQLTMIALLPRLFFLGHEQLWFDETFSAWTTAPGTDFWRAVAGDNHPPLWLLIQKINVSWLGSSEFALRLPAMLCGVGCVLLTWLIARYYFDERTAWTAGLLAALLPAALYFSQDSRMYAGLAFFVLLMFYAGLKQERWLFVLAGTATAYTQNVGVLYVLVIGGGLLLIRRNWRDLVACLLIALLWAPWAVVVLQQLHAVQGGYWPAPLSLGGTISPYLYVTMGWRLAPGLSIPVYAVAIALMALSLINCRRWLYRWQALPLIALVVGVPLALLIFSATVSNVWIFRALLPSAFGVMLLWAYTLHHLSQVNQSVIRPLLVFAMVCGVASHYSPYSPRPDAFGWLAPVRAAWTPGDTLYYLNATDAINYQWKMQGYAYAVRPTAASLLAITADCRAAFGLHEAALESLNAPRAWVLVNHMPYTPQEEVDYAETLLATHPHTLIRSDGDSTIYKVDLR